MRGRVFISYSKAQPDPTRQLAEALVNNGFAVWWDTRLLSGDEFRAVIDREIDQADATVVVWSHNSVRSRWVVAEASHADDLGRLVPVRTSDVHASSIPKPYNTYHTPLVESVDEIISAIEQKIARRGDSRPSQPSPELLQAAAPTTTTDGQLTAVQLDGLINDFFQPVHTRLKKDNAIWDRILDIRKDASTLDHKIAAAIERDEIIRNHEEIASIIHGKRQVVEGDEELVELLDAYLKHVAVYKALRATGDKHSLPIDVGAPWPDALYPEVDRRLKQLIIRRKAL